MIPSHHKHGRTISALCLGTVQLGLPYGIANRTGMPDDASAHALLQAAVDAGIHLLDTARDYGQSEARLGSASLFSRATIMTKLSALATLAADAEEATVQAAVEESVQTSLHCLGVTRLPYLLLHRAQHLHSHHGALWQYLLHLRAQGHIEHLGVSVQTPEEAVGALSNPNVTCIQLPFNILDRRYEEAGIPALLAQRNDVLVIARSALLQGLLTQDATRWPILSHAEATAITDALDGFVRMFGRVNRVDLCLAFVRAQGWIDSVVVGMENQAQLADNIAMFASPPLDEQACAIIRRCFAAINPALLNPALWPKK